MSSSPSSSAPTKSRKRPHAQIRPAGTSSSAPLMKKIRKTYYQQPIHTPDKEESSDNPSSPVVQNNTPILETIDLIIDPPYYTPDLTKPSILYRLAPELRDMIFSLVLTKNHSITITSPSKTKPSKKNSPASKSSDSGAILRVSKFIYAEARPIFFARNQFVVGNGMYGSSRAENLHALRYFVKKTPDECLRLIRGVRVEIWLLESGWDRSGDTLVVEDYRNQFEDVIAVIRILKKKFTGLRKAWVGFVNWWRDWENLALEIGMLDRPSRKTRKMDEKCENALFAKKVTRMLEEMVKKPNETVI